jgi:hypothetical protein
VNSIHECSAFIADYPRPVKVYRWGATVSRHVQPSRSAHDYGDKRKEQSMKTDISSNGNSVGLARSQSFTSRMLGIVFAVGVSACAVYAAANGPALWSGAQQRKAEQVQQENEMFCERFRMPPGGESFATCVGYLSEIRKLHGDRLAAEAAGVF